MPFVRPESVPLPTVWHRFERITDDQRIRKFFVQDATEDMFPFIVDYMVTEFLPKEPMCSSIGLLDEKDSLESIKKCWRKLLTCQMVLVCFEEDPDQPGQKLEFVGCNFCYAAYADEEKQDREQFNDPGDAWRAVIDACCYLIDQCKKIKRTGLHMGALGLSVKESFRGMSIGREILEARTGLCKACRIPMAITLFSNIKAQRDAAKANYETVVKISYEDIRKVDPRFQFYSETTKNIVVSCREFK